MRILFIEDDRALSELITQGLTMLGHETSLLDHLDNLLGQIEENHPELLLLDLEIGDRNAGHLLPFIHDRYPQLPVIVASSHVEGEIIAHCYESGACHYVKKPYDLRELDYLIKSLSSKSSTPRQTSAIRFGRYSLNLSSHELTLDDSQQIKLDKKTYQLLCLLAEEPGRIVPSETILERIWEGKLSVDSLNNHISHLRKLLDPDSGVSIENVKGVGFKLSVTQPSRHP